MWLLTSLLACLLKPLSDAQRALEASARERRKRRTARKASSCPRRA